MLIKASKVIGLPVFTIVDGKKIEVIDDLIYHPTENRIEALLVARGGWFSNAKIIMFQDIKSIGHDALLIESAEVLKKASDVEQQIEYIAKSNTYLSGTKIITEEGVDLGKVSDIYFNSRTGLAEEFEVSREKDKNHEKKRIKISDIITIGKDATIVKLYSDDVSYDFRSPNPLAEERTVNGETSSAGEIAAQLLTQVEENIKQVGSKIQKQAKILSYDISDKKEEIKGTDEAQEAKASGETNVSRVAGGNEGAKMQGVRSKITERRKKDAVGLYLVKNVLAPDDKLLAKEGDMVTYRLLAEAEDSGVLEQILDNVIVRMPMTV